MRDALADPRQAGAGVVAQDQARDMRVQRLANRTSLPWGGGRLDVDSWLIHTDMFHPIFQVLTTKGNTWGIAPRYTRAWQAGGMRNEVTLGARLYAGDYEALRFANAGGAAGAPTLDSRQRALNQEAYLENRTFLTPQLALVAGLKALRHERRYDNRGLPGAGAPSGDAAIYSGLNPRVGLLWQPRPQLQVFANLTRSQDVPDFTDLTQTFGATSRFVPLAAQRAWTAEIGTRGSHGPLRWDLSYYRSQVRGELLQYSVNPAVPAATFNAGRTLHQGVELGATLELARNLLADHAGDRLVLQQTWNWSDLRFQCDAQHGNGAIPGLPRHLLRTTLSYRRADGFYVTPTLDWVPGGAWVDYANTLKTPGYALLGLKLGATLRDGLSFYVDLRNLTNRRYVADFAPVLDARAAPVNTFYPGTGRSLHAGMRYEF
nr:TonB-dependent receptor [Comamonas flocculans]